MWQIFSLVGLALFGGALGLVGGLLLLYQSKWTALLEKNAIPYAAGVLITVSVLGLLPEAVEHLGTTAYWVILAAFFGAYILEKLFLSIHHHSGDHGHDHVAAKTPQAAVWFVLLGDTIHNFIDGVAIGASFLVDPSLGLLTAFSTFLHEVPHEIGDFGVLLKAGWAKKTIIMVNLLSAFITVVGSLSVLLFAENEALLGSLMAISAGVFLYLGAIDFLPQVLAAKARSKASLLPLILGVVTMMVTLLLSPHTH